MRCDPLATERIYNGTDGVIQYFLLDGCSAIRDLASVVRVVFVIGDSTIDSDIVGPSVIWWDEQTLYKGFLSDVVTARLGGQSIVPGEYLDGRLIVYDPVNTNGIVWSSSLDITVVAA